MPCRLTNTPVAFMSLMNRVYHPYLDNFKIVLIDNILVYSDDESDHKTHLRVALQVLKDKQMYAKFSKCDFWMKEVNFLGHNIFKKGIYVDPTKKQTILEWSTPKTVMDIQSSLRLEGYYQRFIKDFSLIAIPMTKLMKKDIKFIWDEKYEESFQTLKKMLTSTSVLTLPDRNDGFVIFSDSSKLRLACALMHHGKVVVYALRQAKVHEQNYATHDLQLVVVVFALKLQRYYLYGSKFEVHTNHKKFEVYI